MTARDQQPDPDRPHRPEGSSPPPALPASQWVTGAHPVAPSGEPLVESPDELATGAVPALPLPGAGLADADSTAITRIEVPLSSEPATRIEPIPPRPGSGSESTSPLAASPDAVTLPPRDAPPPVGLEETLPPARAEASSGPAPAPSLSQAVTAAPAVRTGPQAETVPLASSQPVRTGTSGTAPTGKPPEVETVVPERLQRARRRRLLLLLLLLPLPAFFLGRQARARWFAPPAAPPALALTSPGAGAWAEDEVRIVGRVSGLSEGSARIEGGGPDEQGQQATLGPQGELELVLRGLPEGAHERTLVVRGRPAQARADAEPLELRRPLVLRVDRSAPELTLLEPADGARLPGGQPLSLRLSVRDASSVTLAVRVDGVATRLPTTISSPAGEERLVTLPALSPGPHQLRVEAMDAAGRTTRIERRVEVGDPPEQPPAPPEQPPAPPEQPPAPPEQPPAPPEQPPAPPAAPPRIVVTWPGGTLGELLGAGAGGGLLVHVEEATEVEVALDGQVVAHSAPWQLDPSGLADGEHRLDVLARGPGGEAREQRRFLRDGTAPQLLGLRVTGPASPLLLEGQVQDALDPRPRLSLRLDGGAPAELTGLPARIDLAPGPHTLRVEATDRAGNTSAQELQVQVAAPPAPPAPVPPPVEPTPPTPPPPVPPPVEPGPPPPPPAPAVGELLVRIPARARQRFTIEALAPAALPAGTRAEVVSGSSLLAQGTLPLACQLPSGRHHLTVTLRAPGAPARSQSGWLTIDEAGPRIAHLRSEPVGPARSRVSAEVGDAGPVRLALFLDGQQVADALPCELELPPGGHELLLRATDDLGNESRAVLRVFGSDAPAGPPATPPAEAPWPVDSGDPREEEAVRLFARGQWAAAHERVSEVLAAGRRMRSPYVLRARIHLAYAERMQEGAPRSSHLRAALEDVKVAIINYGVEAQPRHHELHARVLELLGRPTEAARVRERARR